MGGGGGKREPPTNDTYSFFFQVYDRNQHADYSVTFVERSALHTALHITLHAYFH